MKNTELPDPTYIFGPEEAQELGKAENLIEAKGPVPFSYVNIKKAKDIVLGYRSRHNIGSIIQIMPNPSLGKMKNLDITISNAKCPYTGNYYGRYMGMRSEAHIWAPVSLTSVPRTIDLERESDLADWMVIRLFKDLKGTHLFNLLGGKPLFYVKDEKSEMLDGYNNADLVMDTIKKVKSLSAEMLLMVARQLGLTTIPGIEKNLGVKDIMGFVLNFAVTDPKSILKIVTSSDAAINAVLTSAVYSGVIFQNHSGFSYNGNIIGRTKEEVVSYLQSDPKQFQLIAIKTKTSDRLAIKLEKELSDDDAPVVLEEKTF